MSNLCDGATGGPVKLRNSKAYAEGREHAVDGGLVGDDPHPSGSEASTAWVAGFDSYNGGVGTALERDCCADTAYDGVP